MADEEVLEQLQALDTAPQKPINETRRLSLICIGTAGSICISLSFAFNLISGHLQKRYDLSQRDLSTISTVGTVFQFFVIPYAVLCDQFGPSPIFLLACVFLSTGMILLALSFQGIIEGTVLRLSVFNAMIGTGCSLYDLGCVVTVFSHYPVNKGMVVAVLKTFTGLGSAIVGCIYLAFFTEHVDWYFYFLTSFAVMTGILCLTFMRLPAYHLTGYEISHLTDEQKAQRMRRKAQYLRQRPPMRPFYFALTLVIILIIYLFLQSSLMAYLGLSNNYAIAFAIITIFLYCLYLCMAVPLPFLRRTKASSLSADFDNVTDIDANGTAVVKRNPNEESYNAQSDERATADAVPETEVDYIAPQYETTFMQSLCRSEVWLLFWTILSIGSSELVLIFNASYIFGALSGEVPTGAKRTLLTVLNGAGSAMGRLIMSYIETKTQNCKPENRIPITLFLYLPVCVFTIAFILLLSLPSHLLPIPYIIAALGNGFLGATLILVPRTLFAKDVAKFYHFSFIASTIATIVFNRFVYGEWYTRQAERIGDGKVCLRRECILMPMIVVLCVTVTGFITTTWLHIRYRRFCRKVLKERAHLLDITVAKHQGNTGMRS